MPSKAFKKGDMVKVKLLDVDVEKERISLGIKQLDNFDRRVEHKGDVVTYVTAVQANGIEVLGGLTAFIRKADLARERSDQRPTSPSARRSTPRSPRSTAPAARSRSRSRAEVEEDKQALADFRVLCAGRYPGAATLRHGQCRADPEDQKGRVSPGFGLQTAEGPEAGPGCEQEAAFCAICGVPGPFSCLKGEAREPRGAAMAPPLYWDKAPFGLRVSPRGPQWLDDPAGHANFPEIDKSSKIEEIQAT